MEGVFALNKSLSKLVEISIESFVSKTRALFCNCAMKIGILGGTFNPPHLAHLRLGEEVAISYGLSRVIFIPCHIPPHKISVDIAPAADRFRMMSLACEDNHLFEVSDMEIASSGPSYTVNTLEAFSKRKDFEIFFILGTDSLKEISAWKDYPKLFSLANFIVVTRPGLDFQAAWSEVPVSLKKEFHFEAGDFIHESSRRLIPSTVQGLNISATMVRNLLHEGKSVRYLVTESVRSYIIERKLYRK